MVEFSSRVEPNEPNSATQHTGRNDCNHGVMPGSLEHIVRRHIRLSLKSIGSVVTARRGDNQGNLRANQYGECCQTKFGFLKYANSTLHRFLDTSVASKVNP